VGLKKPTKAEIVDLREAVTEFLLENGPESPVSDFPDGIRQALGWVLGLSGRPGNYDGPRGG